MSDVWLRPWRITDHPVVAQMTRDPHLIRWSSLPTLGAEPWLTQQMAEAGGPSRAVCAGDEDTTLGKIALRLPGHASPATSSPAIRPDDHPVGELSYWIVPQARGRGLARAAVRAMLPLVARAGLRTVVLDIELDNHASLRVAAHLGAERRAPARVEPDRAGVPRTLAVHVLRLTPAG
ncbi:MAG TPA: GNAT family N-acetyltransferase [Solirubrobacteraceae bacterium]|nr:GNAT family N-acetyltransferase [Solirubrobacteraceae bacterium]